MTGKFTLIAPSNETITVFVEGENEADLQDKFQEWVFANTTLEILED